MFKLASVMVGSAIILLLAGSWASAQSPPAGPKTATLSSDRSAAGGVDRSQGPGRPSRVGELSKQLAKLQNDLAEMRADGTTSPVDLAKAQANLDSAKALLVQLTALATASPSGAKAVTPSTSDFRELAVGAPVAIAGLNWIAQTPRVQAGPGGRFRFSAKAGERAAFDPSRKIRTELVGVNQFAKGQEIRLKGRFNIDAASVLTGAEWCSLVQIHQADTRRADGSLVNASPLFSLDLLPDPATGKPFLQVRGETGRGEQTSFSPMRILGKLPDVELGRDHTVDLVVVDGHGSTGRIAIWIDGKPLVDRSDIATGYEYVDLLADAYAVRGRRQPSTAYLKIGVYSGRSSGDGPPEAVNVAFTFTEAAR